MRSAEDCESSCARSPLFADLILLSQSSQLSCVTGSLPGAVPSNVLLLSFSNFKAKIIIRHWSAAVLSVVWRTMKCHYRLLRSYQSSKHGFDFCNGRRNDSNEPNVDAADGQSDTRFFFSILHVKKNPAVSPQLCENFPFAYIKTKPGSMLSL